MSPAAVKPSTPPTVAEIDAALRTASSTEREAGFALDAAITSAPVGVETPAVRRARQAYAAVHAQISLLLEQRDLAAEREAEERQCRYLEALEELNRWLARLEVDAAKALDQALKSDDPKNTVDAAVVLALQRDGVRRDLHAARGVIVPIMAGRIRRQLGDLARHSRILNRSPFEQREPIPRPWAAAFDAALANRPPARIAGD